MNKNLLSVVILAVCPMLVAQQSLPVPGSSQDQQTPSAGVSAGSAVQSTPAKSSQSDTLLDGTPVKLRISQTISSEEARTGQEVSFEVIEDVDVSSVPVIKKGDSAFGTVTKAASKKMMGRGGKLDIGISYVRLADQEKVPLRGSKDTKGHGSTVGMTVGMVATGVLFFPAAPLFLLMHGKDVTIPQGTEITAYVQGDTHLDMAKFGAVPATDASLPAPGAPVAAALTSLAIESNPAGAEIEIAGAFVGSTPSTVSLAPGTYQISVTKKGFSTWARTLDVKGGTVHVTADLDRVVVAAR